MTTVIASIQFQPEFGEVGANLDAIERLVTKAVELGATLVVLPELADTGYVFNDLAEVAAKADIVPGGRSASRLIDLPRRRTARKLW